MKRRDLIVRSAQAALAIATAPVLALPAPLNLASALPVQGPVLFMRRIPYIKELDLHEHSELDIPEGHAIAKIKALFVPHIGIDRAKTGEVFLIPARIDASDPLPQQGYVGFTYIPSGSTLPEFMNERRQEFLTSSQYSEMLVVGDVSVFRFRRDRQGKEATRYFDTVDWI